MKTKPVRLVLPAIVVFLAILVFLACHKETSYSANIPPGKANLSVYLTDGPYDFQKVLIDIKSVQVLVDTCHMSGDDDENSCSIGDEDHHEEGDDNNQGDEGDGDGRDSHGKDTCSVWTDLKISPGVYDLLTLRNGNDTLLGTSFIPKGRIKAIKITLGTDNSIMADSITRPLGICNNKDSVIICIRKENLDSITQNNFHLLLDFNLAKSIRFEDSVYCLKPMLRVYSERQTGSIAGEVGPDNAFGLVRAFNSSDTVYALPDVDEEGEFKIRGLSEGTYSVLFQGINGYMDTTINNVKVFIGQQTNVGKITLHK
jgi:hypothetical protein